MGAFWVPPGVDRHDKTGDDFMEKFIYNHENGLWYELHGDYYIPCLIATDEEQKPVGIWGRRHHKYIKVHRKGLYLDLLFQGKLNSYLVQINEQAEEMLSQLVQKIISSWLFYL